MKQYFRVGNALLASFGAILASFIEGAPLFWQVPLAVFLITIYGNLVNDICDVDIDLKNKPNRAKFTKAHMQELIVLSIFFAIAGIILALSVNSYLFYLALANVVLLFLYSQYVKRNLVFAGNLTVAYLSASVFLFGGLAAGHISITFYLFLMAFFATISREILKDLEDMPGDKGIKKTLPLTVGPRKSVNFATGFYALSLISASFVMADTLYWVLIMLVALLFALSVRKAKTKNYSESQKLSKIGMIIGLLAFVYLAFE